MKKVFRITNETGIHARPATALVNEAMKYESDVYLVALKKKVDFKSIMGVMSLGIYSGTTIEVEAVGADEVDALEGIKEKIVQLGLGKEIEGN